MGGNCLPVGGHPPGTHTENVNVFLAHRSKISIGSIHGTDGYSAVHHKLHVTEPLASLPAVELFAYVGGGHQGLGVDTS